MPANEESKGEPDMFPRECQSSSRNQRESIREYEGLEANLTNSMRFPISNPITLSAFDWREADDEDIRNRGDGASILIPNHQQRLEFLVTLLEEVEEILGVETANDMLFSSGHNSNSSCELASDRRYRHS